VVVPNVFSRGGRKEGRHIWLGMSADGGCGGAVRRKKKSQEQGYLQGSFGEVSWGRGLVGVIGNNRGGMLWTFQPSFVVWEGRANRRVRAGQKTTGAGGLRSVKGGVFLNGEKRGGTGARDNA